MKITVGKIASILIAICYVVAAIVCEHGITRNVLGVIVPLMLPLALIWFPEQLGSFRGYVGRGGYIDNDTPSFLVSILGWFFLVGLPVLFYFLWR
jgi:hypothetical protein